ncbi:NAD-P-binding protein [Gautieria morchelliformis]|nr:NAD-P-binding protein [Gautieria morchelliformis]
MPSTLPMSIPPVKVAIVTGAAQGIGRAIALRLAHDGLNVVINDIPPKKEQLENLVVEINATQHKAVYVIGDISCEADVQKLIQVAVAQFGGVDVMVANAGVAFSGPLISTTVEDWDRIHSVNARGTFLCYKAAASQMIAQGRGGRIIGASSVSGAKGFSEWATYSASKFAIKGLTQSVAAELKQYGITVNAYAPGIVDTPIWEDIASTRAKKNLGDVALDDKWKVLPSEDVAGLVSYLIKDEARFVTGVTLGIDGGMLLD